MKNLHDSKTSLTSKYSLQQSATKVYPEPDEIHPCSHFLLLQDPANIILPLMPEAYNSQTISSLQIFWAKYCMHVCYITFLDHLP